MPAESDGFVAKLIGEQAEAHEASVLSLAGDTLTVAVSLRRTSGKKVPYHLRIEASSLEPRVREVTPQRLPTFCPNRHVNVGGYFCLSFPSEDPLPVRDVESAEGWWARLLKYLSLQEATTALRRWPTTQEWAHGDAADHQCRAERCAAALGPQVAEALERRRLTATKSGRKFIRLFDGNRRIYSVWSGPRRVATLRQPCICGSGRPIFACHDHADRAAELPFALMAWEVAERDFWRDARSRTCCKTLVDCPLRESTSPTTADEHHTAHAA